MLKCENPDPEIGCAVANAFAEADPGIDDDCDHRKAAPAFSGGRWWMVCFQCGAKYRVYDSSGPEGFTFRSDKPRT